MPKMKGGMHMKRNECLEHSKKDKKISQWRWCHAGRE
jgi:hypothetical protein